MFFEGALHSPLLIFKQQLPDVVTIDLVISVSIELQKQYIFY